MPPLSTSVSQGSRSSVATGAATPDPSSSSTRSSCRRMSAASAVFFSRSSRRASAVSLASRAWSFASVTFPVSDAQRFSAQSRSFLTWSICLRSSRTVTPSSAAPAAIVSRASSSSPLDSSIRALLISSRAIAVPSRISRAACIQRWACRAVSPVTRVTQASHSPWGTTPCSLASASVRPIPMYPVPICSLYR